PYLKKISELTGDNTYLFIERNNKAVCVNTVKGSKMFYINTTEVGDVVNLNQGGAPIAILAHLEEHKKESVIKDLNLTNKETLALKNKLNNVIKKGFYLSDGENFSGTTGVGFPIFNSEQE